MICKWISQLFVNFYCLLKSGKHQACNTSSFVSLAPSITNHINLLKLTRINCLDKANRHCNDILPRQPGIWPFINPIFGWFISVCLFLWQMCAQSLWAWWEVLTNVGQLQMHLWWDRIQWGHLPQLWVPIHLTLNLYYMRFPGLQLCFKTQQPELVHKLNHAIRKNPDLWLFHQNSILVVKIYFSCLTTQKKEEHF